MILFLIFILPLSGHAASLTKCVFLFQMLHNMKGQFAEHLMHAGFVSSSDPKDPKSNVNSGNSKAFFGCAQSTSYVFINTILTESAELE